jgi:hypothetical protein
MTVVWNAIAGLLPSTAGLLLCAALAAAVSAAPPGLIEVWLVTAVPQGEVAIGARAGAEEMTRTATLLGRRFVLRELHAETAAGVSRAVGRVQQSQQVGFAILDIDENAACDLARRLAAAGQVVLLNARVMARSCDAPLLQLRLPEAARQRLLSTVGAPGGRLDEWHSSLVRFGAGELNERYQKRTRLAMTGDAWAGWFATKVAAETLLRLDSPDHDVMVSDSTPAFDGHKGVALRFDASGVLRQPVYLIEKRADGKLFVKELT